MCWAANSGEPSIPCQLQSSAWCRSPPRREKSFSAPTDHLLLSESQEETILPIISAYGSTHAVSVQSVLLTSPRQMKSYVFHLPLSEIKSWSFCFVVTLPKEKSFPFFTLSTFASWNFQVLCIPVFWMGIAGWQPVFCYDHLSPEQWEAPFILAYEDTSSGMLHSPLQDNTTKSNENLVLLGYCAL